MRISVIIPLYNVEDYLNECMDSVLKQTYENLEIICINNNSTDNSLNILESYAQKDNRINIINNQKNYGIGYSRNIGLKYATGDYVFFMDADDIILENTLEKLLENMISNNSDVVLYELNHYNHFTEEIHPVKHRLENVFNDVDFNNFTFTYKDIKEYFLITPTPVWSKFYKKNFLDKYQFGFPEDVAYEDVIFHVKVLLNASKISFLPEHLYIQRLTNPKSQMKDYSKSKDIIKVCNDVEQYLVKHDFFKELELEFIIFKINQQRYHFSRLKTKEFQDLIKKEFERMNVKGKENKIPKDLFEFYTDIMNKKFFG